MEHSARKASEKTQQQMQIVTIHYIRMSYE